MHVFLIIAVSMIWVSGALFYLSRKNKSINFLIPGFVLLAASFVNVIVYITAS